MDRLATCHRRLPYQSSAARSRSQGGLQCLYSRDQLRQGLGWRKTRVNSEDLRPQPHSGLHILDIIIADKWRGNIRVARVANNTDAGEHLVHQWFKVFRLDI